MSRTLKQLFDDSRIQWGIKSQIMMFVEEANEAAVAAIHLMRTNKDVVKSRLAFAEELSDLQFMLDEMVYYFKESDIDGANFFDLLQQFRALKEAKLNDLLNNDIQFISKKKVKE